MAYGEPGEANGVTVAFRPCEPGAAGNMKPQIDYDQNSGFSLVARVTIDPELSGIELEAVAGHEGQHLVDAQAFAATITPAGKFDLSLNLTIHQTETNAYRITQAILQTSNTPMKFRGQNGLVELGRSWPQKKIDAAIQKILMGPLYRDLLQQRQFRNYDYQP